MYAIVEHRIKDPQTAFARGQKLLAGDGAPAGLRVLQFYPSTDRSRVTCLVETDSLEAVQSYVDTTLGDATENSCFEVDAEQAFAGRPLGMQESAPVRV